MVLFIVPVIALLVFFEYSAAQMENEFKLKSDLFKSKLFEVEVLFMGPSQTAKGINTDLINASAFNGASNMQTIYDDTQIAEKYLDDMPNLKVVVFNVFPPIMQLDLENKDAESVEYYLHHYYHIPAENFQQFFNPKQYSLILTMGYDNFLKKLVGKDLDRADVLGGYIYTDTGYMKLKDETVFSKEQETIQLPDMIKQYGSYTSNEENFDKSAAYLEGAIDKLTQKGVHVVLITTPGTKDYQSQYNELYLRTERFMNSFEGREDVTCVNYFKDERFTLQDFADSSHLNLEGGIKISKIINQELINQILHQ